MFLADLFDKDGTRRLFHWPTIAAQSVEGYSDGRAVGTMRKQRVRIERNGGVRLALTDMNVVAWCFYAPSTPLTDSGFDDSDLAAAYVRACVIAGDLPVVHAEASEATLALRIEYMLKTYGSYTGPEAGGK